MKYLAGGRRNVGVKAIIRRFRLILLFEIELTSFTGPQSVRTQSIYAVNETVVVVTHRVAGQKTGVTQRSEFLFP